MDFADNSTTFDLTINDAQRQLMTIALRTARDLARANPVLMDANQLENTEALIDMLTDMPAIQLAEPGISHGLCY